MAEMTVVRDIALFLGFALLLPWSVSTQASDKVAVAADETWDLCFHEGTIKYFKSETEACCRGTIFSRSPHISEQICCGAELYDSTTGACCDQTTWYNANTHFCCNREVFPHAGQTACCGDRPMDTARQTCCQERPVEGTGECCGNSAVYDPHTQHCCVGADQRGHVHTVGREGVVEGSMQCCGTEVVDSRQELCCHEIPMAKTSEFAECCGPDRFDARSEVCCKNVQGEHRVSPLLKGRAECCSLTPYNRDNDQCCGARVTHDIGVGKCCGSDAYNPLRSSCCSATGVAPQVWPSVPEIPGVQDCCGGQSYLKTHQVCCSGQLHDLQSGMECCGTDLYDPSLSLCCGDQPLPRSSPTAKCCGDRATFEPDEQTCCSGHVLDFPNGSCCQTAQDVYQAFNPDTSKCCLQLNRRSVIGRVHSTDAVCCGMFMQAEHQLCNKCKLQPVSKTSPSHDSVCCTRYSFKTFDSSANRCRNGRVYGKLQLRPGQAWCGGHPYQTADQQCCRLSLQPRTFLADRLYPLKCCGIDSYNPAWESCQHNCKVVPGIPESVMSECRNNAYNNKTHGCYRDYLVMPLADMQEEPEVCLSRGAQRGYHLYDPEEKECCGDTLIGAGFTCCHGESFPTPGTAVGQGRCCQRWGYNPATHTCCDGEVVHELTAEDQVCCGRELFMPSAETHTCCSGRLYSRAGGRTECTDGVAHGPAETVCDGALHQVSDGQCCGKKLMDVDTQICCQDKFLYKRAVHGETCCGRVAYDSSDSTVKCCERSLYHDAQQGTTCCQGQLMNPASDTCKAVGDVSYTFPRSKSVLLCSEGAEYDAARQTCCGGVLYDSPGTCCGNELLRARQEGVMCCDGRKRVNGYGAEAVCCGGQVVDGRRVRCCGGTPLWRDDPWKTCCSGSIMGRRKCRASQLQQLQQQQQQQRRQPSNLGPSLCGGQTYDASLQSCCGNATLYDPSTSGCLDGLLKPLCGSTPYDNATLLCCAGTAHDSATTGCCNGTAYDLSKRTCCAGRLSQVKNGGCCGADGSLAYNADRYLCCGTRFRRRKDGRTACCGSLAYNPNTDTCCADRAIRGVRNGTCCHSKLFDPALRICCPQTGALYRRRPDLTPDLQGCCAPGTEYDADQGACTPQVCRLCDNLKSSDGWKRHLGKQTLIRGKVVVATAATMTNASHHVITLDRPQRLDHGGRQSGPGSSQLGLVIPAHCDCDRRLRPGTPYVVMSDGLVTSGPEGHTLLLGPGDFLAQSKDKLGKQIKRQLCRKNNRAVAAQ